MPIEGNRRPPARSLRETWPHDSSRSLARPLPCGSIAAKGKTVRRRSWRQLSKVRSCDQTPSADDADNDRFMDTILFPLQADCEEAAITATAEAKAAEQIAADKARLDSEAKAAEVGEDPPAKDEQQSAATQQMRVTLRRRAMSISSAMTKNEEEQRSISQLSSESVANRSPLGSPQLKGSPEMQRRRRLRLSMDIAAGTDEENDVKFMDVAMQSKAVAVTQTVRLPSLGSSFSGPASVRKASVPFVLPPPPPQQQQQQQQEEEQKQHQQGSPSPQQRALSSHQRQQQLVEGGGGWDMVESSIRSTRRRRHSMC